MEKTKKKRRPKNKIKNGKVQKAFPQIIDTGIVLGVRFAAGELFKGSPWYIPFVVTWFAMILYLIAKTQG
ncbi:MAG: hypothetical protein FWC41_12565 [Firmicutes bacterium]|nr:hypothetical protein [Bacillota bacterium]